MLSTVSYRFKSSKTINQIHFEGTSIAVWELRSGIISQKNLVQKNNTPDFALIFYDESTNEKLEDDFTNVYRNSMILVERIPLWVSQSANLLENKEGKNKRYKMPPNYVCFRCGQKGHYIQHCPTNEDKSFDLLRFRKPTGIPKAFLKAVNAEAGAPVLITSEGGCVKAETQFHEWEKYINKTKCVSVNEELICNVCYSIVDAPVVTNCGHVYCESCVDVGVVCLVCDRFVRSLKKDLQIEKNVERLLRND
ncbi:E3 ubiquitin-protein ligase RBBP6 [Dictyocoela roeselum]|nr:E3 ubiquitin-protein ligase RBBP6 [Dictyocoela roeselum]